MFPVLVVEDDPTVRLQVRSLLNGLGLDPALCRTPPCLEALLEEVRETLRMARPVAAVVDLGLPEPEEGEAVLALLRDRAPELPLALLTGSSDSRKAKVLSQRFDARIVPKGPRMGALLEEALEGCWCGLPDLEGQVHAYLHALREACGLWEGLRGPRRARVSELLAEERESLTRDHRKNLSVVENALAHPDWPPPAGELAELREGLLGLVKRLPPGQARLAHLLSHRVANNFLLGAEFVQGLLHDLRQPERLLEAARNPAPGRTVRPDPLKLLEEVVALLRETEGLPQSDRVLRLQRAFTESRLPGTRSHPPRSGGPDVPFHRILLIENDDTLFRLLEWALGTLLPGLPIVGCGWASRARELLEAQETPETMLVVLDLSLPRHSQRGEEHLDFGLEVLASARARGFPVVVTSGISEVPEAIQRALGQYPAAIVPKSSRRSCAPDCARGSPACRPGGSPRTNPSTCCGTGAGRSSTVRRSSRSASRPSASCASWPARRPGAWAWGPSPSWARSPSTSGRSGSGTRRA